MMLLQDAVPGCQWSDGLTRLNAGRCVPRWCEPRRLRWGQAVVVTTFNTRGRLSAWTTATWTSTTARSHQWHTLTRSACVLSFLLPD